jgi:F-type H+-transporting ATPase subunit epsilon
MVLNVTVSAPNQATWTEKANKVIITSTTGQVGILSGHAAMVTTVDIGLLLVETINNEWLPIISFSGIAVVNNNDLQILISAYETTPNISEQVAEEELKTALNSLSESGDNINTTDKVLISQKIKAASARFIATQIINKKKVPFL